MKIEINSIQNRILTGFLIITLIALITYVFSYHYLTKLESIRSFDREISRVEVLTLNLIKIDNDFFDLESINPTYFTTGNSNLLNRRDSINQLLEEQISSLPKEVEPYFNIKSELKEIDSLIFLYNRNFNQLAEMVRQRGFKNYGLEGKMREYAHALEDEIKMSNILSLRRHEKDFFLRDELVYVELHNDLSTRIIKSLEQRNEESTTIDLVEQYSETFNELVDVQKAIGINSNEGLRKVLNDLTFTLNDRFALLSIKTKEEAAAYTRRVSAIAVISVVLSLIAAIILSYFIAHRLSKPIRNLSILMKRYMTDESTDSMYEANTSTSEMENLSKSFFMLMRQTQSQMREIKTKSIQVRKQNKELKKLNGELDRFIYSTAHDLRSPLSSVLGLINLAEYDKDEKERDNYLHMMKQSISKLESFIKDVVDYSKNKKLGIETKEVDLENLINDVFSNHQFIPASKEIELTLRFEGGHTVYSDQTRIKIILNNLISNAIRYSDMKKDNPKIDVSVHITSTYFTLFFSDNGLGIDEEHLNNIFQMFYRANELSTGSGLGLFILKETIENLNGSVEVKSELYKGTQFEIRIPNKVRQHSFKQKKEMVSK